VAREEINETVKRPLEAETWAGCVDAVGGAMLARVLGQMKYGASSPRWAWPGGAGLPATVIPFLLRGREPAGHRQRDAALREPPARLGTADRARICRWTSSRR
jgi:NADPH:quinone reductase-like Zn-dependent oxidoreductase